MKHRITSFAFFCTQSHGNVLRAFLSKNVFLVMLMVTCVFLERGVAQEPPKRGLGKVLLTDEKIPVKVLAKTTDLNLYASDGLPAAPFKPNVPYFVFEERSGRLLVDRVQDMEVAKLWAKKGDCLYWPSRRLAYPRNGGGISQAFQQMFGDGNALPEFNATTVMPWPVLSHTADNSRMTVLYGPTAMVGGELSPIDVRFMELYEVHVIFSETELFHSLQDLTGLMALIDSGKLTPTNAGKYLDKFLTQADVDFLDVTEVKRMLDVFPGGSPGYLVRSDFGTFQTRLRKSIDAQIPWLKKVADSKEAFNPDYGVYVVPLSVLHGTKLEGR